MPVEPQFEPRWSDRGLAISEHAGVAVMVWRGAPTPQRIERSCEAFAAISERLGGAKLSLLAIIEERSPPPEVEHFHLVVRGFDEIAEQLLHTVGVLEERVATSAVLEAASIIRSLQRRPRPTKFCADPREACAWLAARHPHDGSAAAFQTELLEVIEATRARLAALPASSVRPT